MRRLWILLLLAGGLLVGACAGPNATEEERSLAQDKRALAVRVASERIDAFNAMGVDPIQLDEGKLLALDTACMVVALFGVEVGLSEDAILGVAAACGPIIKAAGKGVEPEGEPLPEVVPE